MSWPAKMTPALLLPLLIAAAPPPAPQEQPVADATCAAARPAFPIGFEGWSVRTPLGAGAGTRSAPVIVVGRAAELRLVSFDRLTPAVVPARVAEPGSSGGMTLFQVTRPGTYRVALGGPAWIDVVRAGRSLRATAHGHGPSCTGIRKMVDFNLAPGRYILQLTGAATVTMPVMIAHARRTAA